MLNMHWDHLRFFKPSEFADPEKMDLAFLVRLDLARASAGIPFRINSSYRDDPVSAHRLGQAVDIACVDSNSRIIIVSSLLRLGFRRIGVYPLHIHVDSTHFTPAAMWLGGYDDATAKDESALLSEDVYARCESSTPQESLG